MFSKTLPQKNDGKNKKGLKEIIIGAVGKIINRTTALFTAITVIVCFFGKLQDQNVIIDCRICGSVAAELPGGLLNSSVVLWFVLFSFFISIISLIADFMKNKNVNAVITMSVHFVLCYIAFFLIFIRGELFKLYSDSIMFTGNGLWITGFALTLLFIGAYIVVFGLKFLWYIIADGRKSKKEYQKIYADTAETKEEQ